MSSYERCDGDARTVDQLLEPFRKQVAESGITDDELEELFEECRDEVYEQRLARSGKGREEV